MLCRRNALIAIAFFSTFQLTECRNLKNSLISLKEPLTKLQKKLNALLSKKSSQVNPLLKEKISLLDDISENTLREAKSTKDDLIKYALNKKDLNLEDYIQNKLSYFMEQYDLMKTLMHQLSNIVVESKDARIVDVVAGNAYEIGADASWMFYLKNAFPEFQESEAFNVFIEKTKEFHNKFENDYRKFTLKNLHIYKR
jgi:hypothetical protein